MDENEHGARRTQAVFESDKNPPSLLLPHSFKVAQACVEGLAKLRNESDYKLDSPGSFRAAKDANAAIINAIELIDLPDVVEVDLTRRDDVCELYLP